MEQVVGRMQWPVISIGQQCSVATARAKLGIYDIDHLPVVDNAGLLVGIVATSDIWSATASDIVHGLCTRNVITVGPSCSVSDAMEALWRHDVSCLPVTVMGRVVGILTWRDLALGGHASGLQWQGWAANT